MTIEGDISRMKEPFEINSPVEINIPLFVAHSKFKSCFPHVESLIFKGSDFLYYYRTITALFGLPSGKLFCVLTLFFSVFLQLGHAFFCDARLTV